MSSHGGMNGTLPLRRMIYSKQNVVKMRKNTTAGDQQRGDDHPEGVCGAVAVLLEPLPAGFTLIEVVISLFLVGTALVAVFGLQAQNLDLQSETRFITVAQLLAQDTVANIQAAAPTVPGVSSGDFGDDFPGYSYQAAVEKSFESDRLYRILVTVYCSSGDFVKDFVTETYIYKAPDE